MNTKWTCIVLVMLVCILFISVGCGPNAATGSQSNPAAITTVIATQAAAVAPTQAPAPTGALPRAVASTAVPTLAATAVAATATFPTATHVPQSTASSLCDLPFFPIKAGAVWKYHWTAGNTATDETFTVTSVTANGFTRHVTFSNIGASIDEGWTCASQGLTNPQPATPQLTATASGSSTQVRTLKHTGISLPAANMWQVGAAWSEHADLEMTIGSQPGSLIQATMDTSSKITAQEQVTVPAGTFTALLVDSTAVERLGNTNVTLPSSSWYAQGVGLVKQTSNVGTGPEVKVDLLSFTP